MREIKFRLWNKNKKVFYLFELDALLRSAFGQPTMVDGGAMDGITKPWMGFTGLTDKNNREMLKITGFKTVRIIGNIYENPDLLKDYNG